jgi:hypothetical protein
MFRKLTHPLTLICALGAVFVTQVAIKISAQSPTTAQQVPMAVDSIRETITFLTTVGTFIIFAAGIVWWVFWGRNNQQIKEQRDGWKDTAERRGLEMADQRQEIIDLEAEVRELRRMNLRLIAEKKDE